MILFQIINADVDVNIPKEGNEYLLKKLTVAAEEFLRAGGVLGLNDWRDLVEIEREAFVEAGKILRAEMAANIGFAAQGLDHAAQVYSDVDGGELQGNLNLKRSVSRSVQKIKDETIL